MFKNKIIGGILIISGTSIGGGMLGLPIITSELGEFYTILLLFFSWGLMTITAFLTLEVNLCFPQKSNIPSMMEKTLGNLGLIIGWSIYILFLYSLLSAYISGGTDIFQGFFIFLGLHLPYWFSGLFFAIFFGIIVMKGISFVDKFNRFFMTIKILSLLFLIFFILLSNMNEHNFFPKKILNIAPSISISITSFGFSIVVPSLRTYFKDNIQSLKKVIFFGSLIPLFFYIIWIHVIFSTIPLHGENGLIYIKNSLNPITTLIKSLHIITKNNRIHFFSHLFISICIITAFLCVSLGLSDYIADGISCEKKGIGFYIIAFITFSPPLFLLLFFSNTFIYFLKIAGMLCILLQAILPIFMSWKVRYHQKKIFFYQVFGGKTILIISLTCSIIIFIFSVNSLF